MSNIKSEYDFEHCGLKCKIVTLNDDFKLCFVAVEKTHKLYAVKHNEKNININMAKTQKESKSMTGWELRPVGEILTPERYFQVPNGLTFSGFNIFDGHEWSFGFEVEKTKDLSFCINECKIFAEELKNIGHYQK